MKHEYMLGVLRRVIGIQFLRVRVNGH